MFKVGIIGCGGIAESHVAAFRETGRAEIAAVWSRDPEHKREAAQKWNAKPFDAATALIESDVDLVAICTPGFAHREYVERAAAAGKHILCEKPLALTQDDALAMKRDVEKGRVVFMTAFNLRHDPRFCLLRKFQETGKTGETVSAWYRIWAPSASSRWIDIQKNNHWRASNELSGGRINEFGGHGINWLLWVLGKPKTVYGKALFVTKGFTVDDADHAILQCERGVGILEINRHAAVPADLSAGVIGQGGSVHLKEGKVFHTPMDGAAVETPIPAVASKHAHFLDCIESGRPPENGIDVGIETLQVCLAFNRSVKSGQVEPL